jgi:hypothetical protein
VTDLSGVTEKLAVATQLFLWRACKSMEQAHRETGSILLIAGVTFYCQKPSRRRQQIQWQPARPKNSARHKEKDHISCPLKK